MIDDTTVAAICEHARQLAETAPPLTTEQGYLLVTVFSRYPVSTEHIPAAEARTA